MQMKSLITAFMLAIALSACSTVAPNYSPSFQNVEKVKSLPAGVALGSFTAEKAPLEQIAIRANTLNASQGAFSAYLKDAVGAELKMGNKLGGAGDAQLSAVLTANELNTGAGGTGDGLISARFTLVRDKATTYDKSLTAKTTFPSSFIAAIAVPNAINAYAPMVQELLGMLFGDADFIKAVKK